MNAFGYGAPAAAATAVGLVGYCSKSGQPFLVEADLSNGVMLWRTARLLQPNHAKELGKQLAGGLPQNVTIDSGAFACPSCATPVKFWKCGTCHIFHCGGTGEGGRWRGQCGTCSWDPTSVPVVTGTFSVDPRARY